MSGILQDLNPAQQQAVMQTQGPSLVIAGAGSGKTRVLTYKIAWLLQQGVSPSNILALTFTNKAAREMKERIGKLVGEQYARYLWMGTFHSIFSKILRQEAGRIGYTHDYTIYDATDSKNLIKQIVKEMELDDKVYKASAVAARISMAKNHLLTPQDYAQNHALMQEDRLSRIYRTADIFHTYNQRLKQANAMDFDDLLVNMNRLLDSCPDLRKKYQDIFRYILVDEYQDTNYCQSRIVAALAQPDNNICVVGDDAQSIYSFRGADIDNILRFREQFAGARLFKLERNYRSTKNIVGAANSLIRRNEGQIPKEVYSEKEQGELLHVSAHENDRHEGEFIARTIAREAGKAYDDYAVLYRTNAQSRVIEDELRKLGIPYRIYGSVSFYQRREIKDALAYFRLVVNPADDEALLRVINFPARGIGETTMRKVLDCAHAAGRPALSIVSDPAACQLQVSAATAKKLVQFAALIGSFREQAEQEDAYTFAHNVLKQTSVLTAALMDKTQEGQDRYENLQELLGSIHEFVDGQLRQGAASAPIRDFLAEVSLLTDQDEHLDDNTPRVSLMTVHAAKGLEFPVVFIAGMEERLFPSAFAESQRELEEERRLFYVAVTRAGQEVYITHAKQRFRNGQVMFSTPSRFLRDIDERYLDRSGEQQTASQPRWSMPWMEQEFMQSRTGSTAYAGIPGNSGKPGYTENAGYAGKSGSAGSPGYAGKSGSAGYAGYAGRMSSLSPAPPKNLSPTTGAQPKSGREEIHCPYPDGSRVRHATFGDGTVKASFRENGNDKIVIRFDRAGEKTLLLKFARLERI